MDNGVLSNAMMDILGTNATATTTQVILELKALEEAEGKKAKYYLDLTSQIYAHEEDTSFKSS